MKDKLLLVNKDKPILEVEHKKLKRFGEGMFKSICPVCKKGILLFCRDQKTFKLMTIDRCIWCAQTFKYTDVVPNRMTLKYKAKRKKVTPPTSCGRKYLRNMPGTTVYDKGSW